MTRAADDSANLGMTRLLHELGRAQDAALAPEQIGAEQGPRDLGRFVTSPERATLRSRRRLGRLPITLGVVAATAALIFTLVARKPPASRFQPEASAKHVGAIPTLVADARSDLPLRFSDGSSITFRAGSSGQLQRLTNTGAEITLARGSLEAHVIHAATTSWIVRAGPYRVRVTGTRFGLSWRSERLELSLFEGSVLVDGALLGAGVSVRAGHRLTVASGVVRIEPLGVTSPGAALSSALAVARTPELSAAAGSNTATDPLDGVQAPRATSVDPADDRPAFTPRPAGEARAVRPPAVAPLGPRSPRTGASAGSVDDKWLALADRGSYREALAVANRIGWRKLCRRLDSHRLLTLADVARYSDARAPARRAFATLVARFPGDRLAGDAAFSLGRLAFEGGRPTEAAHWFRRYVSDWPNGPLAEQAAGRLLESAIRMQDTEGARNAARAYLGRAPRGAQATLARGVLAEPSDGSP